MLKTFLSKFKLHIKFRYMSYRYILVICWHNEENFTKMMIFNYSPNIYMRRKNTSFSCQKFLFLVENHPRENSYILIKLSQNKSCSKSQGNSWFFGNILHIGKTVKKRWKMKKKMMIFKCFPNVYVKKKTFFFPKISFFFLENPSKTKNPIHW